VFFGDVSSWAQVPKCPPGWMSSRGESLGWDVLQGRVSFRGGLSSRSFMEGSGSGFFHQIRIRALNRREVKKKISIYQFRAAKNRYSKTMMFFYI